MVKYIYQNWVSVPDSTNADGYSVMTLEQFDEDSEHIDLCSSESHASVDIALNLVTGDTVLMY